jgi:hypothetical protein
MRDWTQEERDRYDNTNENWTPLVPEPKRRRRVPKARTFRETSERPMSTLMALLVIAVGLLVLWFFVATAHMGL